MDKDKTVAVISPAKAKASKKRKRDGEEVDKSTKKIKTTQPKITLEPASDSSSEGETMEMMKQKEVVKTAVKKKEISEDSDSFSSEEQVPTSNAAKKKQVETKKTHKSPAVIKVQNKTTKVTTKPEEVNYAEDSSDEEEPAKPVKPVAKVGVLRRLRSFYRAGKARLHSLGKRTYDHKQGYGSTKPVFHKKEQQKQKRRLQKQQERLEKKIHRNEEKLKKVKDKQKIQAELPEEVKTKNPLNEIPKYGDQGRKLKEDFHTAPVWTLGEAVPQSTNLYSNHDDNCMDDDDRNYGLEDLLHNDDSTDEEDIPQWAQKQNLMYDVERQEERPLNDSITVFSKETDPVNLGRIFKNKKHALHL